MKEHRGIKGQGELKGKGKGILKQNTPTYYYFLSLMFDAMLRSLHSTCLSYDPEIQCTMPLCCLSFEVTNVVLVHCNITNCDLSQSLYFQIDVMITFQTQSFFSSYFFVDLTMLKFTDLCRTLVSLVMYV